MTPVSKILQSLRWSPPQDYTLLPLNNNGNEKEGNGGKADAENVASRGPVRSLRHICMAQILPFLILTNLVFMAFALFNSSYFTTASDVSLPAFAMDANVTRNLYNSYIGDVETFLHDHPNSLAESTTFAQMGLFTRLYARLLQDRTTSLDLLESFENSLWFFAPGVKKVRQRHTFNAQTHKAASHKHNRGIVLPVGKDSFIFANHFIASVRDVHKSEMPIEIIYRDEADLPLHMRHYLLSTFSNIVMTGIKTTSVFNQTIADMQGWSTKPFAAVTTNFSQVLMADADAVLLAPPETFFEQEDFKQTGTLFFSDRNVPQRNDDIHNWLLKQFGRNGPGASESLGRSFFWNNSAIYRQESGIMVLDKSRSPVFAALLFAAWQNIKEIRDKVTYSMFHGDKESFWLAFELARLPYYMNNHGAGNIGSKHHIRSKQFCAEHPLHFFEAPNGTAPLIHMQENPPLPKSQRPLIAPAWMNGSMRNNKNNHDSKDLMDPESAIWSMDGEWFWGGDESAYCQRDFTTHTMGEFNLGPLLFDLRKAASDAEKKAQEYLDSI